MSLVYPAAGMGHRVAAAQLAGSNHASGVRVRAPLATGLQQKPQGRCCACRQRPAVLFHELKIRKGRESRPWGLCLCEACYAAVAPLDAVAELLWFQQMGVDAMAAVSAKIEPAAGPAARSRHLKVRRPCRPAAYGGRGEREDG